MGLKEMFKSIDTDNSGTITLEELRTGLPKLGTKISESELMQLMEAVCCPSLPTATQANPILHDSYFLSFCLSFLEFLLY